MATTDDIIDAGTKLAVLGMTVNVVSKVIPKMKPVKFKTSKGKKGKGIW